MSAYEYVFLRPVEPSDMDALVPQLNEALDAAFSRQPSDYGEYLSVGDGIALDLGGHEFENDRDMTFEEFPYVITVRSIGSNGERRLRCARDVFQKLRQTGRYRLLLTADLQQRLDAFDPPR